MPEHFVIIGAQRCGTTYLTRRLDEHPEIEMAKPFRPEPKFFLDEEQYARGIDHYRARYFAGAIARVWGEKSTSYIEHAAAVDRIVTMLPDAPIIVVLRDPVARAVSNHRFSTAEGVETLPLVEALRADEAGGRPWDQSRFSVSPFAYVRRGRYVEALERVVRQVAPERLVVLVFEELVAESAVLRTLYERLGVDPSFDSMGTNAPVNASSGVDALDPLTEAWLRAYYAEPNRRLEELLGRRMPWPHAAGVR